MRGFQLFLKRAFDVTVALVLLVLLTVVPVFLVVALLVKCTSRGPVLFLQERTGKGGKTFRICKFRSMRIPEDSLDENGQQLPPARRITPVGRILRKTSLDELPQLFNVLNGTMSIVGPRPTLPYQMERYTSEQRRRLDMRPGITGLAQVNGRNDLTWTEKIEYDLQYVDHFSLWLDVKILLRTVAVVLGSKGIEFHREDKITSKKADG